MCKDSVRLILTDKQLGIKTRTLFLSYQFQVKDFTMNSFKMEFKIISILFIIIKFNEFYIIDIFVSALNSSVVEFCQQFQRRNHILGKGIEFLFLIYTLYTYRILSHILRKNVEFLCQLIVQFIVLLFHYLWVFFENYCYLTTQKNKESDNRNSHVPIHYLCLILKLLYFCFGSFIY